MSTVNNGPQIVRTGMILDLDASSANSYGPIKAEVLVVAGGGGGGMDMGGGGGGGAVETCCDSLAELNTALNFWPAADVSPPATARVLASLARTAACCIACLVK